MEVHCATLSSRNTVPYNNTAPCLFASASPNFSCHNLGVVVFPRALTSTFPFYSANKRSCGVTSGNLTNRYWVLVQTGQFQFMQMSEALPSLSESSAAAAAQTDPQNIAQPIVFVCLHTHTHTRHSIKDILIVPTTNVFILCFLYISRRLKVH